MSTPEVNCTGGDDPYFNLKGDDIDFAKLILTESRNHWVNLKPPTEIEKKDKVKKSKDPKHWDAPPPPNPKVNEKSTRRLGYTAREGLHSALLNAIGNSLSPRSDEGLIRAEDMLKDVEDHTKNHPKPD